MGSLMAFFAATYKIHFDMTLTAAFDAALTHIYRSGFYRVPLNHFNHHEAKFTAAKLIFGQLFDDTALFEDGQSSLQRTLTRIQKQGMSEYGCLPWFWHWVQAYTCAWHMTEDASTKKTLGEMLDFLWNERAAFYLKGTWVGTHSRGLRHDIPLDGNVLHDYVQFGDFKLPEEMPRTEYAGFLYYAAPETGRHTALNRNEPAEVKKTITKQAGGDTFKLHSYAYITADFAAGGMWERYEEFDNEQHRWDITLPLGRQAGINQGYFFHPSDENSHNDPRHQTGHTEVLYHKNTIIALYPIPEDVPNQIVGVLPKTDWQQEQNVLLGQTGDIYWAVYLMQPYQAELQNDRCIVTSEGSRNGVVMEVMSSKTAEGLGLASFEAFAAEARRNHPVWPSDESFSVQYTTLEQTQLRISTGRHGNPDKRINEQPIDFTGYSI
jgi:hypothetical protein